MTLAYRTGGVFLDRVCTHSPQCVSNCGKICLSSAGGYSWAGTLPWYLRCGSLANFPCDAQTSAPHPKSACPSFGITGCHAGVTFAVPALSCGPAHIQRPVDCCANSSLYLIACVTPTVLASLSAGKCGGSTNNGVNTKATVSVST
jgi:hypothetical protein